MDFNEIWNKATNILKSRVANITYTAWIMSMTPIKMDGNVFIFEVPTKFNKENLIKYIDEIADTLEEVTGQVPEIHIYIKGEYDITSDTIKKDENKVKPVKNNGLIEKFTFDNFIVGASNNFAYSAGVAVVESPGEGYNPLFLYGGVGLGKTHLMNAIGNEISKNYPDYKILYLSCEKFTNELIMAISEKRMENFREKYRQIDLLLIDDIQFISNKTQTQEEFFHTFNELWLNGKQIVISSDRPPSEIENLTKRLTSRLGHGLIADIGFPDFETRTAILREKARAKNVDIPEEILHYIAENCKSNIREMEGILTRVVAYSKLTNTPYSLSMAESAIKELMNNGKPNITIDYIQEVVAGYYNVTVEDLKSKRKTQPLALYRQVAMYLCRKLLANETLVNIGKKFGGKDHSTISNGCDRVIDKMNENIEFRNTIIEIENKITG